MNKSTKSGFLDHVYALNDQTEVAGFYDTWSGAYDATMAENDYATPARSAQALAAAGADTAQPVLDMGCGTGLSGLALNAAGFQTIDGLDLSAEMLAEAKTRGVYRTLTQVTLDKPFPVASGAYATIAAIGLFSPSHAPAETINTVLYALPRGGYFVFSLNDHALADPSYEMHVREWTDVAAARVLYREHGAHLPKIGLEATVYVLQKA